MKDIILKILNEAVWAPSAENCQPWQFEILNNQISILNIPERDTQTWGQRASYFTHGALIENIDIISKHFGCTTKISLFPNIANDNLVANIILDNKNTDNEADPLYPFIKKRVTNRKPFKKNTLTEEQIQELIKAAENTNTKFILETNSNKFKTIAEAASTFEKVLFKNEKSHSFFFNHINWSKAEDDKNSIGFYIKTLELPPPAKIIFPLIKNWSIMQILNKIKFAEIISKGNSILYTSCSAMGCVTIQNNNKESFVEAGRTMQRIWLTATKNNLYIQPLSGINYLVLEILFGDKSKFTQEEKRLITEANKIIKANYNLGQDDLIALNFRLGTADPPTAKSSRLPLIILKNE